MPLVVSPCRSLCAWSAVAPALFACAGCGSQWAPDQPWTPRQADGTVPEAVLAARRDADPAATPAPLSAGSAAATGSAGS